MEKRYYINLDSREKDMRHHCIRCHNNLSNLLSMRIHQLKYHDKMEIGKKGSAIINWKLKI